MVVGKPRDMLKWRECLLDPEIRFPKVSSDYPQARENLLAKEGELRMLTESVAAQRRALPPGGLVKEDYIFESAADSSKMRLSDLFQGDKKSLVVYSMMFPRWCGDERAAVPGGSTAELPLDDQPCPSCTWLVDGLEGTAFDLSSRTNLVLFA